MRRPVPLALELAALAATILFAVRLGSAAPTDTAFMGRWRSALAVPARRLGGRGDRRGQHPRASAPPARAAERHPGQCLIMPHDPREDWLYETIPSETLDVGDVALGAGRRRHPADGEATTAWPWWRVRGNGRIGSGRSRSGGDRSGVFVARGSCPDSLKVKVTAGSGPPHLTPVSKLSHRQLWSRRGKPGPALAHPTAASVGDADRGLNATAD